MKIPILQYRVTVDEHPLATFATEPEAVRFTGHLVDLIATAGGTLAGTVGFGPVKSVAEVAAAADIDPTLAVLDVAAMATAFHATETARIQQAADAAAVRALADMEP